MRTTRWTGIYECIRCSYSTDLDQGDEIKCETCGSSVLRLYCSTEKAVETGEKLRGCKECDEECWNKESWEE